MSRPVTNDETVREHLIDATVRLLASGRPDQLSVRQIAGDAGASTTAIYVLFGGKDGLFQAARIQAVESLYQRMVTTPTSLNPARDLQLLAHNYLEWAIDSPQLYGVLFQGIQTFDPTGSIGDRDPVAPLVDAINRGIAGQRFVGPADAIATSVWVALHGIATLMRDHAISATTARKYAKTTIDALLLGWSTTSLEQKLNHGLTNN
jgi:AcrR family transcriptional regulator